MPETIGHAKLAAAEGGGTISFTDSMEEAFEGADVVYPKSWGRLDDFSDAAAAAADEHIGWICDAKKMANAGVRSGRPSGRPGRVSRRGRPLGRPLINLN